MIRITTIFLCMLLAAAAWGRYRAEVSVREARKELERLEVSKAEELRSIQILRAEVAYLENPERLAKIAEAKTDLRPSKQKQTLTAHQFASVFLPSAEITGEEEKMPVSDTIKHAIAMAQISDTY